MNKRTDLKLNKWYSSRTIHLVLTIAVMLFIFVHSALPGHVSGAESNFFVRFSSGLTGVEEESLSFIVRKAAHFTEFMILGICLGLNVTDALRIKGKSISLPVAWLIPWLMGTAYAVTDEIHQFFVPDRACAVTDMLIDSAGVAFGAMILILIYKARRK